MNKADDDISPLPPWCSLTSLAVMMNGKRRSSHLWLFSHPTWGCSISGVPHIEALLHQAKLLMEEPAPAKDVRPRFKRIEKALVQAEEMATK